MSDTQEPILDDTENIFEDQPPEDQIESLPPEMRTYIKVVRESIKEIFSNLPRRHIDDLPSHVYLVKQYSLEDSGLAEKITEILNQKYWISHIFSHEHHLLMIYCKHECTQDKTQES